MSKYVAEFFVAGLALLCCVLALPVLWTWRTIQLIWRKLDEVMLVTGIACLLYALYIYYKEVIN